MESSTTTIMVKKETKMLLDKAKKVFGKSSYDELIREAVSKLLGVPESLFGVDRGRISEFKEEDRLFRDEE